MGPIRQGAAVIAALLVAGMGCILMLCGAPPLVGAPLAAAGVGLAVWQGWALWKSRRDPYDLSRLFDREPEGFDPEIDRPEEDDDGGGLENAVCHNCGHAVTRPFARCPDCGSPLR